MMLKSPVRKAETKNPTMLRVGVANAYWILVMHTKVCNYCNYYNYYYYY
jgi:hypothetical protein